MATRKSYSRYFIILQEDEKGHSTDSSKFPTGYAKVERKNDKCKVSYYVQNLKRSRNPYYMVLICDRKADKRLLKLGTINIDDYGRAEVSCEYSAENIASSNLPMESIKGAAIVSLEDSSVHGILSGFVSGGKLEDWKSYAVIENQENEKRSQVSETKEKEVESKGQKEKDNIFDKYENDIENAKNIEKNDSPVPNLNDLNVENRDDKKATKVVEEIKASIDEKLEKEALEPIEEQRIEETDFDRNKDEDHHEHEYHHDCEHEEKHEQKHEEKHEHEYKCEHEHDHDHKHEYEHSYNEEEDEENLEEFFEDISEGFEEIKDICKEVGKCKWHKIPYEKFMNVRPYMHFNKYTMVYYPMFNYQPYIRRGGHYLFGYKLNSKGRVQYLVYAIPGTRRIFDQPYGGNTGFVTWVYKDDKKSDDGYWLMFYDFKNSRIVIPIKK